MYFSPSALWHEVLCQDSICFSTPLAFKTGYKSRKMRKFTALVPLATLEYSTWAEKIGFLYACLKRGQDKKKFHSPPKNVQFSDLDFRVANAYVIIN